MSGLTPDVKTKILKDAADLKDLGNLALKDGDFEKSVECYTQAINACFFEETAEEVVDDLHIFYSNRAFAQFKLEFFGSCIMDATHAIKYNPNYSKAYLRRGAALEALDKLKDAKADFTKVVALEPKNTEAREKVSSIEKILKQRRFFAAIAVERVSKMNMDVSNISVPDSYSGPVLDIDKIDLKWCDELKKFLFSKESANKCVTNRLPLKYACELVIAANKTFVDLPTLVDVNADKNFVVCGDVHGQLGDLCKIFDMYGSPSSDKPFLFNGDYVDRGDYSVECLILLLAYRVADPTCLHLNRGNHETKSMNRLYGFERECNSRYSAAFYDLCCELFENIPLVHVINKRAFITHGGLFANDNISLDSIRNIDRRGEPSEASLFSDLLWADPFEGNGRRPSPRGVGMTFGMDVTKNFLKFNKLDFIIRSHEMQENGFVMMHNKRCITVFSAPNYCGQMNNLGAVLLMTAVEGTEDGVRGKKLEVVAKRFCAWNRIERNEPDQVFKTLCEPLV